MSDIEDAFRKIGDAVKVGCEAMAEFARVTLATDGIRNRNVSRAQERSRSNKPKMVNHGRQHR